MAAAASGRQAPRRCSCCTLPSDSARVRASFVVSPPSGRASNTVTRAWGSWRAAWTASASPTGPAPTTANEMAVRRVIE
jgi:hypothetical protein